MNHNQYCCVAVWWVSIPLTKMLPSKNASVWERERERVSEKEYCIETKDKNCHYIHHIFQTHFMSYIMNFGLFVANLISPRNFEWYKQKHIKRTRYNPKKIHTANGKRKEQKRSTNLHTHTKYDIQINSHYPIIRRIHCALHMLYIYLVILSSSSFVRLFVRSIDRSIDLWWLQSTSILNELILNVLHSLTANEKHAIQLIHCVLLLLLLLVKRIAQLYRLRMCVCVCLCMFARPCVCMHKCCFVMHLLPIANIYNKLYFDRIDQKHTYSLKHIYKGAMPYKSIHNNIECM